MNVVFKLHSAVPQIVRTAEFNTWLSALRDVRGKVKIATRLFRLEHGNAGDCAPIGEGLTELRIHFGPGYRVYFGQRGTELIIVLAGGDKGSQERDIKTAQRRWKTWKEENSGQS